MLKLKYLSFAILALVILAIFTSSRTQLEPIKPAVKEKPEKVLEYELGSRIEMENFTLVPVLNYSTKLTETIPENILIDLTKIAARTAILPLEQLVNATAVEEKMAPPTLIYKSAEGKKFIITSIAFENKWNRTVRGNIEGILTTNKRTYEKPAYLFDGFYNRIKPTEVIGNYTLWTFARYEVKPLSTGIAFLVFEVDEDENPKRFIFNTSWSIGPIYLREYRLRNVVINIK